MQQYFPAEEHETRRFLRRVLAKPEDLSSHIRWSVLPLEREVLIFIALTS